MDCARKLLWCLPLFLATVAAGKVVTISRLDLQHALHYSGFDCAFAVLANSPHYADYLAGRAQFDFHKSGGVRPELQPELRREGERVRNERFNEDAERILRSLLDGSLDGASGMGVFTDAIEGDGKQIATEVLRRGLTLKPRTDFNPTDDDHETTLAHFRELFYAHRINHLPPFLMARGTARVDMFQFLHYDRNSVREENPGPLAIPMADRMRSGVFFEDGIFIGAEITAEELLRHQDELLASGTLRELTVDVSPEQLPTFFRSPVLERLTTLSINIVNEGYYRMRRERPRRFQGNLPESVNFRRLNSLRIENCVPQSALISLYQLLAPFTSATRLEHLSLTGVPLVGTGPTSILARLKTLKLNGIAEERGIDSEFSADRDALQNFINSINPKLESFSWNEIFSPAFGRTVGQLFAVGPHFTDLTNFSLYTHIIAADQWELLANQRHLWPKLKQLSLSEANQDVLGGDARSAADRMAFTRQINRILRQASAVAALDLGMYFDDTDVRLLFDGVTSKIEILALISARLRAAGQRTLAAAPALQTIVNLDIRGSSPSARGTGAFADPRFAALRKITCRARLETSKFTPAMQRVIDQFRAREIEFVEGY